MKPVSQIRRERLRQLVLEQGSQVAISDALGKNKNQVYQWLREPGTKGARNIGPASARRLEAAFSKPNGWMDADPASTHEPPNERNGRVSLSARLDEAILAQALMVLDADEEANGGYSYQHRVAALVRYYDALAEGGDALLLIAQTTKARSLGGVGGENDNRRSGGGYR